MSQRDSRRFGILIDSLPPPSPMPESQTSHCFIDLPPTSPHLQHSPTFKYNVDDHDDDKMEFQTPTVAATAASTSTTAVPASSSSSATATSSAQQSSSTSSFPPSSYRHQRSQSQSQSYSSRRKQSSSRRAPPSGLTFEPSTLGPPRKSKSDFPSPGRAPRGQRIFDASGYAEKKEGVEVAQPGWAVDSRAQDKLEDNHYREEHPEEQENMGQRIQRSLSTVKRSASMSVKRAKSLRRPRGNSSAVERLNSMEEDPVQRPPSFEDEDAKMVRLSVIKKHD